MLTPLITAALLPLFNILLAYLLAKINDKLVGRMSASVLTVATMLAVSVTAMSWAKKPVWHSQVQWFSIADGFSVNLSLLADNTSMLMLSIILFVSALVHWFSVEYMQGEQGLSRYFAALGLFSSAMCGLVLSENLFPLFMCWELVGFSSYLLIGFWYKKEAATQAAKQAFLVNRIGDAGLLIGIFSCWALWGTTSISEAVTLAQQTAVSSENNLILWHLAGFGFLLAAAAKSAQFPLQVWLPDAMEGPTPVSALIHAATMVAAGIYLLVRVFGLLPPLVLNFAIVLGMVTMLMAAISAAAQTDIKKVLAYSTISQLGYMVMAVGIGLPQVAIFHLLTHAFFKAALFLCAGSVIHALHHLEHKVGQWGTNAAVPFDAQDMRTMGGLRKAMPYTFVAYSLAAASLMGLPLFSGFLSKETIIIGAIEWADKQTFTAAWLVPTVALLTAAFTAFYMFRQWTLVFMGESRLGKVWPNQQAEKMLHEVPLIMRWPMLLLAALSTFLFFSWNPLSAANGWISNLGQFSHASAWGTWAFVGSMTAAGAGIAFAVCYNCWRQHISEPKALWETTVQRFSQMYLTLVLIPFQQLLEWVARLSLQKMMLWLLVNPALAVANNVSKFDGKVLDNGVNYGAKMMVISAHIIGFVDRFFVDGTVNMLAWISKQIGARFRVPQNGNVQNYIWYALGLYLLWIVVG